MSAPFLVTVLVSGNGSNLQAIIDAIKAEFLKNVQICAVICNRLNAYALTRAQANEIPTIVLDPKAFATREDYDKALLNIVTGMKADLVVLAGFMRILTAEFVTPLLGKIINIHPSLLPKYPGLNTHQKVIANGDQQHGLTIHYVTPELDAGPVICQSYLAVDAQDTVETLQTRIHELEHMAYPQAIAWISEKRISLAGHQVLFDNRPLPPQGLQNPHLLDVC